MMNVRDIANCMADITYKPGWEFHILEDAWEGPLMRIVVPAIPDSYHPGAMTPLGIDSYIPPMRDRGELLKWLAWRLGRIEMHEMREFLKHRGRVVFDPHKEDVCH